MVLATLLDFTLLSQSTFVTIIDLFYSLIGASAVWICLQQLASDR